MALMSEERRREMEEEMSRFEQEIAAPADTPTASSVLPPPPLPPQLSMSLTTTGDDNDDMMNTSVPQSGPTSEERNKVMPGDANKATKIEPHVIVEIPTTIVVRPAHVSILPPPPPPPLPPMIAGRMQFIPHQLQRQPMPMHRPPMRPPFGALRGPVPSLPPDMMRPFPPPPPPPPHHMLHPHPGMPQHMQMPMGMMQARFVPQSPVVPVAPMVPGFIAPMNASVIPSTMPSVSLPSSTTSSTSVLSQAVYAAAPVKSFGEKEYDTTMSSNGESISTHIPITSVGSVPSVLRTDKSNVTKPEDNAAAQALQIAGEEEITKKKKKQRKVIRMAGGQIWEDNSLQDWDTDDFRIFCGDLGNDVTDEVLTRAFSKYTSFVRAKVIRDKRTNKTKGFGFVSFKDPQDFIKAMREMNGRYVGSRPIKLRKSTWRDRNIEIVRKKHKEKEKLGLL